MATQEWHDPVRALDHYAQATRRRAGAVDASTALTLSIAATQQADTAAFATQFGERIDALESYLATKRTNLKRVLQQGDAGTDSLIGISAADEARLDEDADDIAAIRREFQQYAERQATLARRVLLPLATARAPIAEDTGAREGITNMVRRMSHRFEPSTRSTWAIRGAVAAALIAHVDRGVESHGGRHGGCGLLRRPRHGRRERPGGWRDCAQFDDPVVAARIGAR